MTKMIMSLAIVGIGSAAFATSLTCTTQRYSNPNGRITAQIDGMVIAHVDANLCHEEIDDCVVLGAEQVSGSQNGEDLVYSIGHDSDDYSITIRLPVSSLRAKKATFTGHLDSHQDADSGTSVGLDCSQN